MLIRQVKCSCMDIRSFIKDFFVPKIKFAMTSSVATIADYGIYIALTLFFGVSESVSHAISYSIAVLLNFYMHKTFIFSTNRKLKFAFTLSVSFSLLGWLLSQVVFNFLIYSFPFFKHYDILAKIISTALVFFYNFYTKRFSFEKKLPWEK